MASLSSKGSKYIRTEYKVFQVPKPSGHQTGRPQKGPYNFLFKHPECWKDVALKSKSRSGLKNLDTLGAVTGLHRQSSSGVLPPLKSERVGTLGQEKQPETIFKSNNTLGLTASASTQWRDSATTSIYHS